MLLLSYIRPHLQCVHLGPSPPHRTQRERRPRSVGAARLREPHVRRTRRHAARGRGLPERPGVQRHRGQAQPRRGDRTEPRRRGADGRGHGASRAVLSARDGPSGGPAVRGPLARPPEGPDRPQDQEAGARRKMVAALRVAFFGTPQFAVPSLEALLASRHAVCGVVTQPDRPRGRGQHVSDGPIKALAVSRGLPLLQPASLRDPAVEATLRTWAPDLGVVVAYGQLVPGALLALPRLGLINVHPSILPRHRGAAPVHRAIIAGDSVTGVSIMRVGPRLDAGAVFAMASRAIGENETSDAVETDLSHAGARLLADVVDRLADGEW